MDSMIETVKKAYARKKEKNPNYSLRAFANFLNINPTSLSLYLNKKRELSPTSISKIIEKLQLNTTEVAQDNFVTLGVDESEIISDWYYFALHSLIQTRDFKNDVDWIANRLSLSPKIVSLALDRLCQVGLIKEDEIRGYVIAVDNVRIHQDVPPSKANKNQFQMLDLAEKSLENDPATLRHFSGMTFSTNPEKLIKAFQLINRFREKLAKFLDRGDNKTEVYRLNIQLFPLSHRTREEGNSNL
ncbi:MAG: TIGR02147 family protein [Pseudobacteriovorax sp.]|nr:TIGR02147 family protein [Pseudobacteriovorax sp.]